MTFQYFDHTAIRSSGNAVFGEDPATDRSILEDQFQAELQFPHVDSGARARNRTEASGTHNRLAVGIDAIVSQGQARVTEVWVVQKIERLEPELQVAALSEVEILLGGEVKGSPAVGQSASESPRPDP